MVTQVAEEERTLDAVNCALASVESLFQAIDRGIGLSEASVHISEVVRRDKLTHRPVTQLLEYLPCRLTSPANAQA